MGLAELGLYIGIGAIGYWLTSPSKLFRLETMLSSSANHQMYAWSAVEASGLFRGICICFPIVMISSRTIPYPNSVLCMVVLCPIAVLLHQYLLKRPWIND